MWDAVDSREKLIPRNAQEAPEDLRGRSFV